MSERSRLSTSSTTTIITTESLTTKEKITTHSEGSSIEIWVRTNHYFLVSKPVLTEVPWFEKFFSEQQDQAKYYLPDNNGLSTLRMLFSILHHKLDLGDSIPVSVSELFRIAAVCNKYNVADIVMPHVEAGKWIEPYWEDQKPRDRDWVGWVKILGEIYRTEKCCPKLVIVLDVISANMHLEGGRWIFECGKKKHHVAEMDYWDTAGVDSESRLQDRRRDLWNSFRTACACLSRKQLTLSDVLILEKFQTEDVLPSDTIVTKLCSLLSKRGGTEVEGLLQEWLDNLYVAEYDS